MEQASKQASEQASIAEEWRILYTHGVFCIHLAAREDHIVWCVTSLL